MGCAGYLDEMQTHRHITVAPEREEGWKVKMDLGGGAAGSIILAIVVEIL